MRCLLYFVENYVLPLLWALLAVALILCLIVIAVKPAHGAEAGEYTPPEWHPRWSGADWRPRHTSAAITELLARYYDAQQTRACLTVYPACYENGMMGTGGKNPSASRLYQYGLIIWGIDQFVAYQLDAPFRDIWQWLRIAEVGITIKRNHDVHEKFGDALPKPEFPAGLLVLIVVPFFF